MNTLFKSMIGGFGRVLGRFIFYIFIGFVVYLLIKYLGIDIKSIIPNIGRFIL